MLIIEKLKLLKPQVADAVDELFDTAEKNQFYPNDLLLVFLNASRFIDWRGQKYSHLGNNEISHSYLTQYEFINEYRQSASISEETYNNMTGDFRRLNFATHLEMFIYQKFWESDIIIRQLYEVSLLAQSKPFEWNFEVPGFSREGSKQEIIRKEIRDSLRSICPKFYSLIKECYNTQIKNAITHSDFYMVSNTIAFLNYSEDPKAHCPLPSITRMQWEDYITKTLLLHSETTRRIDLINLNARKKYSREGSIEIMGLSFELPQSYLIAPDARSIRGWLFEKNPDGTTHQA
jgi:hypothetical protein